MSGGNGGIGVDNGSSTDAYFFVSVTLLVVDPHAASREGVKLSIKLTADGEVVLSQAGHNSGNGFQASSPQEVHFEPAIQ